MKPSNKVFIIRTNNLLEQYQDIKDKLDCSYSRTLFINCCVGLLLLSKEIAYKMLPDDEEQIEKWGISLKSIIHCTPKKSPKQVTRHLRNAISHGNFDFTVEEGLSTPINHISFTDQDMNGNTTFRALIPFDEFRLFVLNVSQQALKVIEEKK